MNTMKMRAVVFERFGGPEVLHLKELDRPSPGADQVLIEVEAAGVNFGDTMMHRGTYPLPQELPARVGSEVAGYVRKTGVGVEGVTEGERVMATLSEAGGYAEYAVADAARLTPLPDGVDAAQALGLLAQGLTAYGLLHTVDFARGKRVLVTAAAGGVGSLLLQLARLHGASQLLGAVGSEPKQRLAEELGADASVNYRAANWHEDILSLTDGSGVDVVFDAAGGTVRDDALRALAPFGTLVSYGGSAGGVTPLRPEQLSALTFNNQSFTGFAVFTFANAFPEVAARAQAEMLAALVEGTLRVVTQNTFQLDRVAEAHRAVEARQTVGKVVLTP